jgi:hypothetical protein
VAAGQAAVSMVLFPIPFVCCRREL